MRMVVLLVLPTTSETSQSLSVTPNPFDTAVSFLGFELAGVRQQLFCGSKGDLYAQWLVGAARGYSRRCDLCSARATQFGLGANVVLSDSWAVRVRGDIRVGGSAADLFYPMLGVGITRAW